MTAVAGSVFTAAQFNQFVRDNLNATAPALASVQGQIFVSDGVNSIAARLPTSNTVPTSQTTGSTSFGSLATAGPAVTVTCGAQALVLLSGTLANNTSGQNSYMSYAVSGATTVAATDDRSIILQEPTANQVMRFSLAYFESGLTPGSNTFTAQYRVSGGTGSFSSRILTVVPL